MPTTFIVPDYTIGNSADCQTQSIGVLQGLDQALQALQPAPVATTVQFNNTILLQDPLVLTDSLTISETTITHSNPISPLDISSTDNGVSIIVNNVGYTICLISGGGASVEIGDVNNSLGNDCLLTVQPSTDTIKLDAFNVNSFGYAMPICFTRERADTFFYNFNGTGTPQTIEMVYSTSFSIPQQFVADSPYTSTYWKIDFALNTWNNSVQGDKGIALYFTLQDATTFFNMSPQTYNATTPYAVYQPSSTFVAPSTNNAFQNYNWTDYIDLAPIAGGGGGVLPLNILLNFAGDSVFTCNFQMTLTLTRTNMV